MEDANLMRWTIASIGLIIIMVVFALLARKVGPIQLGQIKGERRMKIKEILHLDTRNKIYIVEVDGEDQMVGVGGVTHLSALKHKNQSSK